MIREKTNSILRDLEKKMVFLVGPRQVGKTWLAQEIGKSFTHTVYLNYDNRSDREIILRAGWLPNTELLILDEIQKHADWQTLVKGIYDTRVTGLKILVTGSSQMDILRHFGESLSGRYYLHRLMPLSISELCNTNYEGKTDRLLSRGGFPEPFLCDDHIDADRWRQLYIDGMIRYDLLDLQSVIDFKAVQLTLELLREKVGSPVSFSSIARDVSISPSTVLKYVQLFEALYIVFRVSPYSKNIARSILKEPKVYFYDNGMVKGNDGVKFENIIAVELLRDTWNRQDTLGQNRTLAYLRDKEGHEVDFALIHNDQIIQIAECKLSDNNVDRNLYYFAGKYGLKASQLVYGLRNETLVKGIEVRKVTEWLKEVTTPSL